MLHRISAALLLFAVTLFACGCDSSSAGKKDTSLIKPGNKSSGGAG
jgi:hypothetical protein